MDSSTAPRILGDFKIVRELGRGGMGVVYLARQLSLARDVALKVLSSEASADSDRILRFQREAALLGRLAHPNIVRVFVVGEDQGLHFLAMEFVEGTDLERVLANREDPSQMAVAFGRDFLRESARVVRDAARGLGAAHAEGIVHRDIKPSNVLLADNGRVVLADFGLARDLEAAALTRTGTMLGTPYYMSPERFRAGLPTPAGDVYALGAVLYECATGGRPFEAPTPESLMSAILEDEPEPLRRRNGNIPRDLETIALKCLEKDPLARYPDGVTLAEDLSRFLEGEPIEATAVGTLTRIVRRTRRRRVSLLMLLGAVLAAGLILGSWLRSEAIHRREKAHTDVVEALDDDELALARRLMDDELATRPDHERVRFDRAELALREGRWDDAAADFEALVASGASASSATGLVLARSIAAGKAVEQLPTEPEVDARDAYYRGLMHQTRREFESAIVATQRALELDEGLVEAWYALGGIHYRRQEFDEAEKALDRYDRVRSRADVKLKLAKIDFDKERFESAVAYYERYTRMREDDVVGWNSLAGAQMGIAMRHAEGGDDVEYEAARLLAEAAHTRAMQLDPSYFLVIYNRAILHLMSDEIEPALERFREAIRVFGPGSLTDREWMPMWVRFGGMLNWAGEGPLALSILEEARDANPAFESDPNWVAATIEALILVGRVTEGEQLLEEAMKTPLRDAPSIKKARAEIEKGF